jgi:chromosome partition protein MukB
VRLKVQERSAYHKLQKIHQSGSIMSLLESENIDFEEFIKELGKNLGYNKAQVTENDVLDYKNYFDIEIELYDESGNLRDRGLSNGENLGTNIVVVESINNKMLPIVLDEADRLDSDSLNTLYEIALTWGLQLIVALPNLPNFNKGMHYHLISGDGGVVMPHVRFEMDNA